MSRPLDASEQAQLDQHLAVRGVKRLPRATQFASLSMVPGKGAGCQSRFVRGRSIMLDAQSLADPGVKPIELER